MTASGLIPGPPRRQLNLLPEKAGDPRGERWDDATKALDDIRRRFGADSLAPATLLYPHR